MGSPSGHALRAAAAAAVDCILRPKAGGGRPEPPEPPEWTPGRHLSAQQLPRVTRRPKGAERRVESPGTQLPRRVCSGRGDYVLSDLSVLLLHENKGCGTGVEFRVTL